MTEINKKYQALRGGKLVSVSDPTGQEYGFNLFGEVSPIYGEYIPPDRILIPSLLSVSVFECAFLYCVDQCITGNNEHERNMLSIVCADSFKIVYDMVPISDWKDFEEMEIHQHKGLDYLLTRALKYGQLAGFLQGKTKPSKRIMAMVKQTAGDIF